VSIYLVNTMSRVAIVKGTDPVIMTEDALHLIHADLTSILSTHQPILIKPNYINAKHPSTGITTDARVVEGIVKYFRKQGSHTLMIGEGSGWAETMQAFKVAGIDRVAEQWAVTLVDLNHDHFVSASPPNPLALTQVRVAQTAIQSTIISVPKLKSHGSATVTLGLKNMMGALASKGTMHNGRLHQNIADLASLLPPQLTVIDGVIAGEGHETRGRPLALNLVIAGVDPVATDTVGAAVMGIPPATVQHLRYAAQKGLGTNDLNTIRVLGESIARVQRRFARA
jgi:uncharacterized protein (DUF362 family)